MNTIIYFLLLLLIFQKLSIKPRNINLFYLYSFNFHLSLFVIFQFFKNYIISWTEEWIIRMYNMVSISRMIQIFIKFKQKYIQISELFIYTYKLNIIILLQKDSIDFALYDSNWPEMNIKFKKLLLLTIRMIDADKLKLRATMKQIVNLELFTNVRKILEST